MFHEYYQKQVQQIFHAGVTCAAPERLVQQQLTSASGLSWLKDRRHPRGRLFLIAAGTAAGRMVTGALAALGRTAVDGGIAVLPPGETLAAGDRIQVLNGNLPLPGADSLRAGRLAAELASQAGEGDVVLMLLSGGAESMLEHMPPAISAQHLSELDRRLLAAAASEAEVFTVHRHLSLIKNGQLASAVWPAWCVALILSDRTGDAAGLIGGGLTATNCSKPSDALDILRVRGVAGHLPAKIGDEIRAREGSQPCQWPRVAACKLGRTQNVVLGSGRDVLQACWQEAKRLGFHPEIASAAVQGDSRAAGAMIGRLAQRPAAAGPVCYLAAGNTTVTAANGRVTGPAQELALAAAISMAKAPPSCLLSADLGGIDGQTSAAGAYVFNDTLKRAQSQNVDAFAHLQRNDAFNFFTKINGLFTPGPTGITSCDVMILLAGLPQGDPEPPST